ncbi:MAG: circadian clock protein KaiC, partial [Fimbriimonadaceae bacterium]
RSERSAEEGQVARYGLEEFVCDNVVILRNNTEGEKRRRTVEILKLRGAYHQKGQWPFTVVPNEGLTVLPLSALDLQQRSSEERVTTGVSGLDDMVGGGFYRGSVTLVSGATGTGKTLLSTQFLAGGAREGERCLLLAFEESRDQLTRNAMGWGVDFAEMQASGHLHIECSIPESHSVEDQLIRIRELIDAVRPTRVALDGVSALSRVSSTASYREFVISLASLLKKLEITALLTSTSEDLLGGSSITEAHISTITDTILLLRYVEFFGEIRRGINVLKMRGSAHDKHIREYEIGEWGLRVGAPFHNVLGILSGDFRHVMPAEIERLGSLFDQPTNRD